MHNTTQLPIPGFFKPDMAREWGYAPNQTHPRRFFLFYIMKKTASLEGRDAA